MKAFQVPPVCTALWDGYSWAKYEQLHGVETEPETIQSSFGIWYKTGRRNAQGEMLYNLNSENKEPKK